MKTNYKCYECKQGPYASRQSLQKALCKDGKQHFICRRCAEAKPEVTQPAKAIMVMQCACGNMAASHSMTAQTPHAPTTSA